MVFQWDFYWVFYVASCLSINLLFLVNLLVLSCLVCDYVYGCFCCFLFAFLLGLWLGFWLGCFFGLVLIGFLDGFWSGFKLSSF